MQNYVRNWLTTKCEHISVRLYEIWRFLFHFANASGWIYARRADDAPEFLFPSFLQMLCFLRRGNGTRGTGMFRRYSTKVYIGGEGNQGTINKAKWRIHSIGIRQLLGGNKELGLRRVERLRLSWVVRYWIAFLSLEDVNLSSLCKLRILGFCVSLILFVQQRRYFDILSQNMNNMSCMYVRPIMKILSGKEVALIKSYGRSKSKNSHFFCALSWIDERFDMATPSPACTRMLSSVDFILSSPWIIWIQTWRLSLMA